MKLSVNLVGQGRYWKAGEEIPGEEVPDHLRRYAVVTEEKHEPVPSVAGTQLKRSKWGGKPSKG